ncbi:response regulator [Roseovarius salis]|uniref:response regulator n=1 Tax=Roseovarius salis TaxID=3376063 RepID=UPI0037CAD196
MTDGTLLVVEDDEALRTRLAKAMHRRGFTVKTASGATEAREQIAATPPDYAIIDLRLEDGSGLDVVHWLETRKPGARCVILTGYGDIPTAVAAARIGAIDYIAKPATANEILDALMAPENQPPPAPDAPIPPEDARWEHIRHVYEDANSNVTETARLLNMHRRSLQRILRRRGVTTDAGR